MKENEIKIRVKYQIGSEVYLKTDPDQFQRMVVGYLIMPGFIKYVVCLGEAETNHYDIELSEDRSQEYICHN